MAKRFVNHDHDGAAFTLVEMVVSIAVLGLLVLLMGQMFSNTTTASAISTNHLEADARVRVLFTRIAADFSHMVKRTDIDYYLKSPTYPQTGTNDQMAFYSEVSGYSTVSDAENSVSLVAYRVNVTGAAPLVERMGKALSWSGGDPSIQPVAFLPATIAGAWPTAASTPATSSTNDPAYDQDYETIVPNAFRLEYYYLLHSGVLSATPWNTAVGHTSINGLEDVAGIGVVIAVTDAKASAIATSSSLQGLAAQMEDFPAAFPSGLTVGGLQQNWETTVSASTLSSAVKNGVHVYEQLFSIDTPSQ